MNPIDELKAEHRGIETALAVLESIADRIASSGDPETHRDAEALIDFFKTFADTCHHGKEENVLFPALERVGVLRQGGPIGVLLDEHDLGRSHIRSMATALNELRDDHQGPTVEFEKHAQGYIQLLRRHIEKEDQVLFQMADQRLTEEQETELTDGFERIERDIIGEGKHEQYHAMLDDFKEKYGV